MKIIKNSQAVQAYHQAVRDEDPQAIKEAMEAIESEREELWYSKGEELSEATQEVSEVVDAAPTTPLGVVKQALSDAYKLYEDEREYYKSLMSALEECRDRKKAQREAIEVLRERKKALKGGS